MKSLLRDLCSVLGPYCKKCICAEWSVFSDPVTIDAMIKFTIAPGARRPSHVGTCLNWHEY